MLNNHTSKLRKINLFQSKPVFIPIVLTIWLFVMGVYEYFTYTDSILPILTRKQPLEVIFLIVNQLFVALFFLYGITNIVIAIRYAMLKNKVKDAELAILAKELPADWHPKVELLYTTYNDFIPYALAQCLDQTYDNTQGVILDNSTDPKYIKMIDDFVIAHPNVKLVRDSHNKHAKAGNLNHYLCNGTHDYDYFVILDSDELLENQFVEKCLKMFYYNDIGILQCNHVSGQNSNSFMSTFSSSGNAFWPVQNVVRSAEGGWLNKTASGVSVGQTGGTLCIELGHGVMMSRECFEDIGQMPHAVSEDLCTSIEAILKGWNIKFASQIYGNEAFPVNMSALLIRSGKFCSGNLEFLRKYASRIIKSKTLNFYQKLDLFCFTLSSPISACQYISLIITSIICPILHIPLVTQLFMLWPVLVCYFSQTLVDGVFHLKNGMKFFDVLVYEVESIILYGSFYFVTVKSTVRALMNKPAKFNVTPKVNERVTFLQAFKRHYQGILFSVSTIVVCIAVSGSSWVLLSFIPGCFGFLFEMQANHRTSTEQLVADKLQNYSNKALHANNTETVDWND
ncbi:glycosyltransferase family 2 protein [Limosilactobacillus fermentum]|uniref:glycosyltransferase n=1 Tax=Limosilactobacillus fermentum TaxID=1613 RepID=UPI000DC01ABE|nr:glycosyltransferase family 2 protein [Limosilactobacillus fermentum]RAM10359.1 glycosyltransferase family 2 protein [Limosilactobacillus fermentum]